jgi:hypothetical protein
MRTSRHARFVCDTTIHGDALVSHDSQALSPRLTTNLCLSAQPPHRHHHPPIRMGLPSLKGRAGDRLPPSAWFLPSLKGRAGDRLPPSAWFLPSLKGRELHGVMVMVAGTRWWWWPWGGCAARHERVSVDRGIAHKPCVPGGTH